MDHDVNVFDPPAWERELGRARGTRVGANAGARDLGASLFELDPGGQAAPYHLHHANEELLLVLSGTLELRTPHGTRSLAPGVLVAFGAGPDGAHRLRNTGDEPARYLMVSTQRNPEIAEYPDTGAVLAMRGPGDGWAFPEGSAADYLSVVRDALAAEPEAG